ncbi:hypothetical protein ACEPAI_7453 [Sanghuangporus weigelae]
MARAQPQVPQLSLNGTALSSHSHSLKQPTSPPASANSANPTARPPKSPAAQTPVAEIDSAWGANFWVTLIEPQSQTPFYACPATGHVSWDPPVGNFVLPPNQEGEWWELIDESRGGIPYYYHTVSKETVWERPDAFIIPLAILQNTAACKRLSARYSQAFDPEAVKAYTEQQQQQLQAQSKAGAADLGGRPAVQRALSDNMANQYSNSKDVHVNGSQAMEKSMRRRSASASGSGAVAASSSASPTIRVVSSSQSSSSKAVPAPGSVPQTPKRSAFTHGYPHNHHHFAHGFGGTHLPPIPASPYQSQTEGSASDAEEKKAAIVASRAKEKERQREVQEKEKEREKERGRQEKEKARLSQASVRSKSVGPSTGAPRPQTKPQQSLSALASRIANERGAGANGSVPPTPVSPVPPTPSSDTHGYFGQREAEGNTTMGNMIFAPRAASSPARVPSRLTVNVGGSGKTRDNVLPTPTSPVSPGSLNSPFSSLSKGKGVERLFGANKSQTQNQIQDQNRMPPPPIPTSRKSMSAKSENFGSIRTQDIGAPRLDAEATMNMSPVKARTEGKPILIDVKNSLDRDGPRHSTGGRPILPEDLAVDIQQFVHSEFARQYFATHRTGIIFRKKIPVEKMMVWQKAPLQQPLLLLNRGLHKDTVKMFKVIQRIMGDRDRERAVIRQQASDSHLGAGGGPTTSFTSLKNTSSTSLPSMVSGILEEERWLIGECLTHGELRDEIYCQLVKQLTGNSNPESLFRGWQFMCVLLVSFPPSKNFESYLRSFIQQNTTQPEGRVDVMAKYCLQRLFIISKKGPRGKPPTIAEIETASDAAFNPSTFGESLDAIIRLQERTYPHLQVPIILPFLADGILALGGLKSEGIFRIPGDGDSVGELKIRIERGYYNLEGIDDPHVPASLLKLWLRELADPLVPTELYNDCVACSKDPEACVAMVPRLPTIQRRVVLFVISFLQLFLDDKVQATTKMTSANLALVMAPNLLRCESESMTVVFTNAPYEQMFVHNLLLHLKCNRVDPGYVPKHGLGTTANASKPRNRRPGR